MRNQWVKIIAFAIAIAILLIGCWDAIEITDMLLGTVFAVDKQGEEVRILLEYQTQHGQPMGEQASAKKESKVVEGKGASFTDARREYLNKSRQDVYIGSLRSIVLAESYAKEGISEYLNRARGMREYRKTVNVYTTLTDLDALLDSKALEIDNIGFYLDKQAMQLQENKSARKCNLSCVLEHISTPNTGFYLENVDVVNKTIERTGYSIFKNGKMIGIVANADINGINFLVIPQARGEYTFDFDGVRAALSVEIENKKIEPIYYTDGSIEFQLAFKLKCGIIYLSKMVKLTDGQYEQMGDKIAELVKQDVQKALKTSQKEFGCDYMEFYKCFRAKYESPFLEMNWNEQYEQAKFTIDVEAKVAPGNFINYELNRE